MRTILMSCLPDEHQHDVTIGHRHEHTHAGNHHHEHGDTGHNHEHHSDCAQHCHQVKVSEEPVHHHHEHRNLHDIAHIITHSDLHDKIKMQSLQVFTALAEAEIEYKNVTSPSIYVKMELMQDLLERLGLTERNWVVIWTTTPWTLPANMAISIKS